MATVKISNNNFKTGVRYAKKVGGRFDPTSKTWTLPDTQSVRDMLNAPGNYGWIVVPETKTVDPNLGIDDPAYWWS